MPFYYETVGIYIRHFDVSVTITVGIIHSVYIHEYYYSLCFLLTVGIIPTVYIFMNIMFAPDSWYSYRVIGMWSFTRSMEDITELVFLSLDVICHTITHPVICTS